MPHSLPHGRSLDVGAVGIEQAQLPPFDQGPLDLRGWFGDERRELPLELEIGSGKGTFLVQQAPGAPGAPGDPGTPGTPGTPGVNYIGIEYARAFWRYAADRVRRHGLVNVKLVHAEAGAFLRNYVPPGCLRQIHVYFPDPWPKARHHKRRLIQEPTLRLMHHALEAGGLVRLVTDHDDYFQWMQEHADRVADLFERLPFSPPAESGSAEGELVGSNFERKYRREGRPFNAMALHKR
jgi:tRNA (guanine-N7-)-methyltransferase